MIAAMMKGAAMLAAMAVPASAATLIPTADTPLEWVEGVGFRRVGFDAPTEFSMDRWGECLSHLGDEMPGKAGVLRRCDHPPARPAGATLRFGCSWLCPPLLRSPVVFGIVPPLTFDAGQRAVMAPAVPPAPVPLGGAFWAMLAGLLPFGGIALRRIGGAV